MLGKVVGNYRITRQIGEGGMGVVYEAEHVLLGKKAAIKVLLPERSANKEIVDRFFNEAKASTMVHHPGIVEIFDYGQLDTGSAYIVMEYLEGESLGQRLRRMAPLTPHSAVSIARHIAGTLAAAHMHGIVHRDLKPDNVFLVPDPVLPRGERAKVLDFGIAKLAGPSDTGMAKTDTGRVMGTPMYMSPEQCRGSGKVDQRSDIYALGCVLYHMLVGRPPFIAEGSGEVLAAHIHLEPQLPSVYQPDLPPEVELVVMRLLAKRAEDRYQSMDDVIVAFNDVSEIIAGGGERVEPSLAASDRFEPIGRRRSRDMAYAPTTLGSTAGESVNQPGTRRSLLVPGIIAAAAAIAAGIFLARALASGDDASAALEPAPVEATEPEPASEPAPPEPIREPIIRQIPSDPDPALEAPVTAPEPATVTLDIDSTPSGARVYRESDGVRIGVTPFSYRVLRGEGEAVFIVKRNRYRAQTFSMPVDRDGEMTIELDRRGKNDPPDPEPGPKSGGPVPKTEAPPPRIEDPPPRVKPGKDEAIDPFGGKLKPDPKP